MRAVITVIGTDMVGILAKVATRCAEHNVNVMDVTQSVLQDMFAMIMLADVTGCDVPFDEFSGIMEKLGGDLGLSIRAMHEDIFNAMHRV